MTSWLSSRITSLGIIALIGCGFSGSADAQDQPGSPPLKKILVGPETEQRFPPMQVPDGFQPTLFACDPLIEYPSVITIGPRPDTLFVAHDYVTGLGVEIVRRDEIRLLADSDGDGYADRSNVYAGGFNSIQGLSFYDGNVFVMHAPYLTWLRDTDGDDEADERRDLITGLGLPPEENSNRLHCANGVVAGHDGWLYLALGDRGCDVQRPEGDRLLFQQGGILRCRSNGSDLHVFSTGLRNIYDIVLDEDLNVFVRDNENDGGDYMIRVCHCFFGSDHGYPYHYYERPDELMPPLADLGRGSSAGGTSYLETAFPQPFRESLFFCEWGRAIVRYHQSASSSSFKPMQEIDFAAGAPDDPYGFKPTDLVVGYDGSLFISDWCDGQRPKRGRGRIYRIEYIGKDVGKLNGQASKRSESANASSELTALIEQLGSPSHHKRVAAQLEILRRGDSAVSALLQQIKSDTLGVRARQHAVWIITLSGSESALEELFQLAESDPETRIRAQAVRAIGDLTSPVLTRNRVNAGRGDQAIARRIAKLAEDADPRVVLEAMIVMRRLQWPESPAWVTQHLRDEDPALNHAATQALRNAGNWPAVVELLQEAPRLRRLALHAMAEQRLAYLADELMARLQQDENPRHRREYADALTRIVRQEQPWTYWGFRPAPRPAATVDWEKTADISTVLDDALADRDFDVRAAALGRMQREGVTVRHQRLADWLRQDTDEKRVATILAALDGREIKDLHPLLTETVQRRNLPTSNRLSAVRILINGLPDDAHSEIVALAHGLEDGPILALVLREFGTRPKLDADAILLEKLSSPKPEVRAESIRSLGKRGTVDARHHVAGLLKDQSTDVRQAAAESAGPLDAQETRDALLVFALEDHRGLVTASLQSLQQLKDDRAVQAAVAALKHRETQTAALRYLSSFGTPGQIDPVVKTADGNRSVELQREATRTLVAWQQQFPKSLPEIEEALATIQGRSGQPLAWQTCGPLSDPAAERLLVQLTGETSSQQPSRLQDFPIRSSIATGDGGEIRLDRPADSAGRDAWVAWTPIRVNAPTAVEFRSSASGEFTVWLGATRVYARPKSAEYRTDSDRFSLNLPAGTHRLRVEVRSPQSPARFHLRFRRRSSKAEHERLIVYTLQSRGNPGRGGDVFAKAEQSLCVRCHRLGNEGGRIGPDLTGIGSRFSRIHLIESILEPSRSVAPSYSTLVVVQNDGRVLSGIRISETADTLVLGDNQGKVHEIPRSNIDEISTQQLSTMPEGLEKKLTDQEFVDLLAFLESQKKPAPK